MPRRSAYFRVHGPLAASLRRGRASPRPSRVRDAAVRELASAARVPVPPNCFSTPSFPMRIVRRFRRSMGQEFTERRRFTPRQAVLVAVLAVFGFGATDWPELATALRFLVWLGVVAFGYLVVAVGFAQVRAKAQPLDHTLTLEEDYITVLDNYRGREHRYRWSDFRRVAVTPQAFELRREGSDRGETYMIARDKLSAAESKWLAERLLEL